MIVPLPRRRTLRLGPEANGILLSPREFDAADFDPGHRYELVHGVLVVSPAPLEEERDPNQELGYQLLLYQRHHPEGSNLDHTLPEHTVLTGSHRRRADRVIWAGLGRKPRRRETPTIVVEFVSRGRTNLQRDYETKRDEYLAVGVREYWIFDRFDRTLTVWSPGKTRPRRRIVKEGQVHRTPLLPGFEVPLDRLLELADAWQDE